MADSSALSPIEGRGARCIAGLVGGLALLVVVNAVAMDVAVPLPAAGLHLRLAAHLFEVVETVGLGLVFGAVAGAFARWVKLPWWGYLAVEFVVAVGVVYAVIGEYLYLQAAHALGGRVVGLIYVNYFLIIGAGLVSAPELLAPLADQPRKRWAGLALAVAGLVVNQIPLRDDYFGVHGLAGLGGALIAAPLMAPWVLGLHGRLMRSRAGRVSLGVAAVVALCSLVIPPPNAVRCEQFRQPCAVAPWTLATLVWRPPSLHAPVSAPPSPWAGDRANDPPVAPSSPSLIPRDPVVVLLTIDALRADVVADPANDARFPTFAAMKRRGVVFDHVTAAGTQTPGSLTTMFTGLYYSEQRWADYGDGGDRFPYPAADPAPRFPELLTSNRVDTMQATAYVFLAGRFGVARGFHEEALFGHTRSAAPARQIIDPLLVHLEHADPGPIFLYAHMAEPHAPYHLGPPGDDWDHYLSAVAVADGQVGRVLDALERRFGRRWMLIVSADHGEAFGEHQTYEHAKTLYEELVHVPLLVVGPVLSPRHVPFRVGLVDLGPTLLDLFQVPTPATFHGQSLVPLLRGQSVTLTRPLMSEGRLRRAITLQDGLKVIEDPRFKTVEVYDLTVDPGETRNLFDVEPGRSDAALAQMRAFFEARTLRAGGYEPPYKP